MRNGDHVFRNENRISFGQITILRQIVNLRRSDVVFSGQITILRRIVYLRRSDVVFDGQVLGDELVFLGSEGAVGFRAEINEFAIMNNLSKRNKFNNNKKIIHI